MATETSSPPQNTVALGTSFGLGIVWWIMAGTCLWSSARGYANHRYDWGILWGIVGLLLAAAGTAAMFGTWWHFTRVHHEP